VLGTPTLDCPSPALADPLPQRTPPSLRPPALPSPALPCPAASTWRMEWCVAGRRKWLQGGCVGPRREAAYSRPRTPTSPLTLPAVCQHAVTPLSVAVPPFPLPSPPQEENNVISFNIAAHVHFLTMPGTFIPAGSATRASGPSISQLTGATVRATGHWGQGPVGNCSPRPPLAMAWIPLPRPPRCCGGRPRLCKRCPTLVPDLPSVPSHRRSRTSPMCSKMTICCCPLT